MTHTPIRREVAALVDAGPFPPGKATEEEIVNLALS
jgi:hypothetical protein